MHGRIRDVFILCCLGDAEWKSLAYGAPCIQLVRHGNGNITDAIFTIRIVIAEVESGNISLQ